MRVPKWIRSLFRASSVSSSPGTGQGPAVEPPLLPPISRRQAVVGALACLSAPEVAASSFESSSLPSDPFYVKKHPPEEKVVWSKADECFVWISKLMGKDEREWDRLEFQVTAGISGTDPKVFQKGDRIRMFLGYDSPEGMSMGTLISVATHKSIYSEPRPQSYAIASVTGMDAVRPARLIIASPGPFVVHSVSGKFRVTPAVVARYRSTPDDDGNPRGSMPDPEIGGTVFYREPQPPVVSKRQQPKIEPVYGGEAEMENDPYKPKGLKPSEQLDSLDKLLAEAEKEDSTDAS